MNQSKLKKEGRKWVEDEIITDKQLTMILSKYRKHDQSYLLILFAVLLTSIGILIFIYSDWAQTLNVFRIVIMCVTMLILYGFGHFFSMRIPVSSQSHKDVKANRPDRIYGMSFITLAYIFFGATLFLILSMYEIDFSNVWPFIIWSLFGFLLYMFYGHALLFIVGLLVNVSAQFYSWGVFSSFSLVIFALFIVGYFYYTYRQNQPILNYAFSIVLSLQILMATASEVEQYYWYICFVLIMYGLGEVIQKTALKTALIHISLLSILIFKLYESFLIQEDYFLDDIEIQSGFFIVLSIILLGLIIFKWYNHSRLEIVNFILFIPLFFLPKAYLFIIISMFFFSLFWLIIGFQKQYDDKIKIGMISFMLSAFTVYIQYAWETLNKSLFFLIGGVFLFFVSFILERTRRQTEKEQDAK